MNLKIEDVAAPRSFVFLWCGSYEGLDHGREVGVISMDSGRDTFSVEWVWPCLWVVTERREDKSVINNTYNVSNISV